MALEILVNQATRNQVYLERLKSSEVKKAEQLLIGADKLIRRRLLETDLTDLSRARLEVVLADIDRELKDLYAAYGRDLQNTFSQIALIQADRETQFLNHIAPDGVSFTLPAAARVIAAIQTDPLAVKGFDGGKLLDVFLEDASKSERDLLTGAIRQGYFQGQSNSEILKVIRGTKANGYSDGLLAIANRDAEAVLRTAIQHVASSARNQVYEKNADLIIGYEWVSTLDNRTSQICRSLDGVVFKKGKGPMPPAHVNCRSTTVPALDKSYDWLDEGATRAARGPDGKSRNDIPATQSYYQWLKNQPAEFQDDALGPARGLLFRNGGISPEEFARLNLGRSFQPLTLEEMRIKDPLAFKKAGI